MNKIFCIVFVLLVILPVPASYSQLTIGEPATQKAIVVTITEQGEVHVSHKVQESNKIVHVDTIPGTVSNLEVVDVNGDTVEFGTSGIESISGITIFSSDDDIIIEYDLDDALFLNGNLWTWDLLYLQTTTIILPESLDLVYVNSNPVMLHDAKGITCHGCQANIEYANDQQMKMHEISWEDKSFSVVSRTSEISSLIFDQPTKRISFDVEEENQLITLVIPLELLWNPYEVFLDDKQILKHEFFSNETHAWLNIRPESSGTIDIIGTTVVPEFPIFAPLLIGIAAVIILQLKNKLSLH